MLANACAYIRLILPLTGQGMQNRLDVRFVGLDEIESFRPDVVIVQRLAASTEAEAEQLIALCRLLGAKLVYEIDDDLLAIGEDHPEYGFYRIAAQTVRQLGSTADEIWVSTEALAASSRMINRNVVVLHNYLDPRIWRVRAAPAQTDKARILYMGTTTHSDDFEAVFLPAFQRLVSDLGSRVRATIIGVTEDVPEESCISAIPIPIGVGATYPSFASWLQSLPPFDIGVAPLTDTPFNGAKSHIKWLEYSALGLATVASSLAEYPQSINDGVDGILAGKTVDEFHTQLRRVVEDCDLRAAIAHGAGNRLISQLDARAADPRLDRLERLCGVTAGAW